MLVGAFLLMDLLPKEVLGVCQLFGFLPLMYSKNSNISKGIKFSFKYFLWGLTLTVFQVLTSFFAVSFDYMGKLQGTPVRMVSNTAMIAVFLDIISLTLLGCVFFYSSTKNYQHLIEVYCNLNRFDSTLQHKFKEVNVKTKIFFIFSSMTVFVGISIWFYYNQMKNFLVYCPLFVVFYLQAAQFIHFTYTCQILKERFMVINHKIKQAVIQQNFDQLLKDFHFDLPLPITGTASASVAKIRSMTDLFWILCEAAHQANTFYSSQLLLVIISSLIHITMTLYYVFIQLYHSTKSIQIPHLLMRLLWISAHSCHLILLVFASNAVTKAADGAAPMVCKLINRRLDLQLRKHVSLLWEHSLHMEIFLIQLRHHNVRFSALGFFNVHSHILTSIAGSVTTYLVILIQFQTQTQINQPQTQTCPKCNCTASTYQ